MTIMPIEMPTNEPQAICYVCKAPDDECGPCDDCGNNECQCDCACECGRGPRHREGFMSSRFCVTCLAEEAADAQLGMWKDER